MKNYFKVNEETFTEGETTDSINKWLQKSKPLNMRCCTMLLYSTALNYCIGLCSRKYRLKRLFLKTEDMLEASLDIRTLLRMQSLLVSHLKVFYESQHYPLLKLQRHARTIVVNENKNSDSEGYSVIYGRDSDPEEQKALQAFTSSNN